MKLVSTHSGRGKLRRVIVVGGGVAGLTAALHLARSGVPVLLFSLLPEYRSVSVTRQDGITVCSDATTLDRHLNRTLAEGGLLAHQPPVVQMLERTAAWVEQLVDLGVSFERCADGTLERHICDASGEPHTVCAGTSTGRHIVRALFEQVLRLESDTLCDNRGITIPGEKPIQRLVGWEALGLVQDDQGVVVGIVAQQLGTMKIKAFRGDAVCLATGGCGMLFGTGSGLSSTGTGIAIAARHGAVVGNLDLVGVEATALAEGDFPLPIGTAARAAGGRLWVPKNPRDSRPPQTIPEGERNYFLERQPGPGNLQSCAAIARALVALGREGRLGISERMRAGLPGVAYLDLTHLNPTLATSHLSDVADIGLYHAGVDVTTTPLAVFPAASGLLGGVWVDYETNANGKVAKDSPRNQATSLPGLYAAGDVEYQYHGGGALAGNLLSRCHVAGALAAEAIRAYDQALDRRAVDLPASVFERAEQHAQEQDDARLDRIERKANGEGSTAFGVRASLAELMTRAAGLGQDSTGLDSMEVELDKLGAELRRAHLSDNAARHNQALSALRQTDDMLLLARLVLASARGRALPSDGPDADLHQCVFVHLDAKDPVHLTGFSTTSGDRSVEVNSRVDRRDSGAEAGTPETVWSISAPPKQG